MFLSWYALEQDIRSRLYVIHYIPFNTDCIDFPISTALHGEYFGFIGQTFSYSFSFLFNIFADIDWAKEFLFDEKISERIEPCFTSQRPQFQSKFDSWLPLTKPSTYLSARSDDSFCDRTVIRTTPANRSIKATNTVTAIDEIYNFVSYTISSYNLTLISATIISWRIQLSIYNSSECYWERS